MLKNHPRIRLTIYMLSLLGAVASPFAVIASPELGAAVASASSVLAAAAGVTALTNLNGSDAPAGDHAAD